MGVGKFKVGKNGASSVKLQEGGRFLKDEAKHLPIDVIALDSTPLIFRATESMEQLGALIGTPVLADLRERLAKWEMLSVHADAGAVTMANVYTYYRTLSTTQVAFPTFLPSYLPTS